MNRDADLNHGDGQKRPVPPASLDLSSHTLTRDVILKTPPAQPKRELALELHAFSEQELKYVVSRPKFDQELDLYSFEWKLITQEYFPTKLVPALGKITAELALQTELPAGFSFSQVRLREVCNHSTELFLQAKGRCQRARGALDRFELSTPISEELYRELLPLASAGHLRKQRFDITRDARELHSTFPALQAEVDVILEAGKGESRLPILTRDFLLVDIEIPIGANEATVRSAAEELFPFLAGAIELSGQRGTRLTRPLSARRMARHGLSDKACRIVKQALES